jgi:hypothetical protein
LIAVIFSPHHPLWFVEYLPKRGRFLFALTFLLGATIPACAVTTCTVDQKLSCSAAVGCQSIKNSIIIRIDWNQGSYSRCDAKGCDDFSMQFLPSGDFINVDVTGHGMLAKISKNGASFTEVITIMETAIVSFGNCKT